MNDFERLNKIANMFDIDGKIISISEHGSGIINRTFFVKVDSDQEYILQKINTNVFAKPYVLMRNIDSVTSFCREAIIKDGGNPERETLSVVKSVDNKRLVKVDSDFFRMYKFVKDCKVFDQLDDAEMFGFAGEAFGRFANLLNGYPIEELDETIPDFHNSKVRYANFLKSIKRDPCGRVSEVLMEIGEVKARFFDLTRIIDLMEVGEIPVRVTHNDTKISNVLFDKDTNKALCVIDLDTVMPGSILFDFGDAIRSGASICPEDKGSPKINLEYFRAFSESYVKQVYDILTPMEIENLAFSCRVLTLELAMRFLDDYINGDTYFTCKYEDHNLVRARNQLDLLMDMERHYGEMQEIIIECIKKCRM